MESGVSVTRLELDSPERTTCDYAGATGPGHVQEALNMAFADEGEVMFVGDKAYENVYVDSAPDKGPKLSDRGDRQHRAPSDGPSRSPPR